MKSTRRSMRNHHDGYHEPGDPLGVYMPPLSDWRVTETGAREWIHPRLGWVFSVGKLNQKGVVKREMTNGGSYHFFSPTYEVYGVIREWYSGLKLSRNGRISERNPDWSAMREKASHYAGRAAAGARDAYEWTAPRARAAGHAAWEGTKAAGRAVKRGAKRAAPVIARGAKSAAERMDRWAAEPNGRKAAGPKSLSSSDIATIKRVSPTVPTSQYAKVVRLSVGNAEVSRPYYDRRGRGSVTVDTAAARYIVSLRDGDDVIVTTR